MNEAANKLNELAAKLPKDISANALALVEKMTTSIEGLGDDPDRAKWRATNIKLVQGTTDRSKLPRGAVIGTLVLGERIMEQPLRVIPLGVWNGRQMWSPDQNEAKLLCSSHDGKVGYFGYDCKGGCPHSVWNEETKRSECGATFEMLVITEDLSEIFKVQFAKTNYQNGKQWFGKMKEAGVAIYRRVYGLKSETNKQYKQVESLVVEYYSDAKEKETSAESLEFISELFKMVQGDRKEMLDGFHKMVMEKRAKGLPVAALPNAADAVVMIEATPAAEASSHSKKYDV